MPVVEALDCPHTILLRADADRAACAVLLLGAGRAGSQGTALLQGALLSEQPAVMALLSGRSPRADVYKAADGWRTVENV